MEGSVKRQLMAGAIDSIWIPIAIPLYFLDVEHSFTNYANYEMWHIDWRIQSSALTYNFQMKVQEE